MEIYIALILALGLACVAGVQFYYLMFLEMRGRHQDRRINELERENIALLGELRGVEARLQEEIERNGELWPEVIDEDRLIR